MSDENSFVFEKRPGTESVLLMVENDSDMVVFAEWTKEVPYVRARLGPGIELTSGVAPDMTLDIFH